MKNIIFPLKNIVIHVGVVVVIKLICTYCANGKIKINFNYKFISCHFVKNYLRLNCGICRYTVEKIKRYLICG